MNSVRYILLILSTLTGLACHAPQSHSFDSLTACEARVIARDAYIYGYPLVESYRNLNAYFVNQRDEHFEGPWNHKIYSSEHIYGPLDISARMPNADALHSRVGLDLRTEPMVLTFPGVGPGRYYSLECYDLYTNISGCVSSRAGGNEPGRILVVGPGWKGRQPSGFKAVILCDTELAYVLFRTVIHEPLDLENVKRIQTGYEVEPLSSFLHSSVPKSAPPIHFIQALDPDEERDSLQFFSQLSFVLGLCPVLASERDIRARLAKLGIGAHGDFDPQALSPELVAAVTDGMHDAWKALEEFKRASEVPDPVSRSNARANVASPQNKYLARMQSAVTGIWPSAREEQICLTVGADAGGEALDASVNHYVLRLTARDAPPAYGFWSLTLYDLPWQLLVANPLQRYAVKSTMLPGFKQNPDGSISIYIQYESPGPDKESNWLPAPSGPFMLALRMYWPTAEALNGTWKLPGLQRVP